MTVNRKNRRAMKKEVRRLIASSDFDAALSEISRLPTRSVTSALLTSLCAMDIVERFRAARALGQTVARLFEEDPEAARNMVRRQMWNLNEESGGCAWGAPEAMAEMLYYNDELACGFAHVLVSYIIPEGCLLDYELLQRGAVWGIGRVAEKRPDLVKHAGPYLADLLKSNDHVIRALSVRAIGLIKYGPALNDIHPLLEDESEIELFMDGEMIKHTVAEITAQALKSLEPININHCGPDIVCGQSLT